MLESAVTLQFDPLLGAPVSVALGLCLACIAGVSLIRRKSVSPFRILLALAVALVIANPSLRTEERIPEKDIVLIAVDKSASMTAGSGDKLAQATRDYLGDAIAKIPGMDIRFAELAGGQDGERQTRLHEPLSAAIADIQADRRAGVILITDGQLHDASSLAQDREDWGPLHVLLTGARRQIDRRIVIVKAPVYGLRGKEVTLRFKVEDQDGATGREAEISLHYADGKTRQMPVKTGQEENVSLTLANAGPNVFEISTPPLPGETITANNSAALTINGVRDRLRVLLVSGQPYQGTRAWRDLLKSDPGVDLVHFTILREPDRLDPTPGSEVSLIAFPFRELFEEKLSSFDLIIFDRYRHNQILPDFYFRNIAEYVRSGGALLVESGPEFAAEGSIFATALGEILPGRPGTQIISQNFRPAISDTGATHPVTQGLGGAPGETPRWGEWMRYVPLEILPEHDADTLLQTPDGHPLLMLSRVEDGRAAQLASDSLWLWQKGYEGGGPYAELMRRLIHWLMKEPALDEHALRVERQGRNLNIHSRAAHGGNPTLKITEPQGRIFEQAMQPAQTQGTYETLITDAAPGIWRFEDAAGQKTLAVAGDMSSPEMQTLGVTDQNLRALSQRRGGGIIWLGDNAKPKILHKSAGQGMSGPGWIGLRRNGAYSLTGYKNAELLSPWMALALLVAAAMAAWLWEGRR